MLSLGLIALLVAACGQQVTGEPQAARNAAVASSSKSRPTPTRPTKTTTRPPSSSTSSSSDRLAAVVGTWEGEYTCGQGNTGLKLTIKLGSMMVVGFGLTIAALRL